MVTSEEHRRKRLGSCLVDELKRLADDENIVASAQNDVKDSFWGKLGFVHFFDFTAYVPR